MFLDVCPMEIAVHLSVPPPVALSAEVKALYLCVLGLECLMICPSDSVMLNSPESV